MDNEDLPDYVSTNSNITLGRLLACTWNVAQRPSALLDVSSWLGSIRARMNALESPVCFPDIIVIGLQEWTGFVKWTHPRLDVWEAEIDACIEKTFEECPYQIIRSDKWVGIALFIALRIPCPHPNAKLQNQEDIENSSSSSPKQNNKKDLGFWTLDSVEGCFVGTGPLKVGNKGALSFLLDLSVSFNPLRADKPKATSSITDKNSNFPVFTESSMSTVKFSICFVNVHLCAGPHRLQDRNEDFREIYERLRFNRRKQNTCIEPNDASPEAPSCTTLRSSFSASIIFWLGDLNYRLFDPSFESEYKKIIVGLRKQRKEASNDSSRVTSPNPSMIWPVVGKVLPSFSMQPESTSRDVNIESLSNAEIVHPFPSSQLPPSSSSLSASDASSDRLILPKTNRDVQSHNTDVIKYSPTPISSTRFISDLTHSLQTKQWDRLLPYDQLLPLLNTESTFEGFEEATIQFPPSYKYKFGTQLLTVDDVEKHWPAWCDRILYRGSVQPSFLDGKLEKFGVFRIVPVLYDSCREISTSDHKPVYGLYDICYEAQEKSMISISPTLSEEPSDRILKASPRLRILEGVGNMISGVLLMPAFVLIFISAAFVLFIVFLIYYGSL